MLVRDKIKEQHKRARRRLFGKFQHIRQIGDKPLKLRNGDIVPRIVNLPEIWSTCLSGDDREELQKFASSLDYDSTMAFFRKIRAGTANLPQLQIKALKELLADVEKKFQAPQ